jgi:hypothetical protein
MVGAGSDVIVPFKCWDVEAGRKREKKKEKEGRRKTHETHAGLCSLDVGEDLRLASAAGVRD